jgi:hypothetical protein
MVRKAVESYRRRAIDQAIDRMTKHPNRVADVILFVSPPRPFPKGSGRENSPRRIPQRFCGPRLPMVC